MKIPFATALACAVLALSACNPDPQAAYERRQALIKQSFPNPADRHGLHLVFPVSSALEVIYFPAQVSQSAIDRRVAGYCQRLGKPKATVKKAPAPSRATLADGSQVPAVTVWYDCDA